MEHFDRIEVEGRCPKCLSVECGPVSVSSHCKQRAKFCRKLVAAYDYEGNAEVLVGALKIGGRAYLAEGMAALMVLQWLDQQLPFPDLIVPIPSSPLTLYKRGFSPSKLLAESVSELLNRPLWCGLAKELSYQKQSYLNVEERLKLSREQIVLRKDPAILRDKQILLIDDVMTTGQTLQIAATRLLEGSPRAIDALVFAR